MAKDYARGFYNSFAWRRTQAAYMASRCYVCERCGRPARIVHHKNYITPQNIHDPYVTLDWANLEALCIDCHNAEHISVGACAPGLRFNSEGELVPTAAQVPTLICSADPPPGTGITGL